MYINILIIAVFNNIKYITFENNGERVCKAASEF